MKLCCFFDVKSLFTSILVDLALAIAKERLQQDQQLTERTNMSGICAN